GRLERLLHQGVCQPPDPTDQRQDDGRGDRLANGQAGIGGTPGVSNPCRYGRDDRRVQGHPAQEAHRLQGGDEGNDADPGRSEENRAAETESQGDQGLRENEPKGQRTKEPACSSVLCRPSADYRFIPVKNSTFDLVRFMRLTSISIASTGFMSARTRRSRRVLSSSSG